MKQTLSLDTLYPGTYLAILSRLLMEKGVDIDGVLSRYQLQRNQLLDPMFRLPLKTASEIISQCVLLSSEPDLGFRFGQRIHLGSHGDLGIATLASETLGEALTVYCKYSQVRIPFLHIEMRTEKEKVIIRTRELLELGELQQFNTECYMSSFFSIMRSLGVNVEPGDWRARVHYKRPKHFSLYARFLPCVDIEYNALEDEIEFCQSLLSHPMPLRSASTCQLAIGRLNEGSGREYQSTVDAVRAMIEEQLSKGITLAEVALSLNCSPRTLIRKLAQQGYSYKLLVEHTRKMEYELVSIYSRQ